MLTGCLNSLVEDGSQGDGRGLDGGKVCRGFVSATCASARDGMSSRRIQDTSRGPHESAWKRGEGSRPSAVQYTKTYSAET